MNAKNIVILLIFSLIGWAFCGGVIAIGRSLTTTEATLIIHVAAVPVIFSVLSYIYFKNFNYMSSLATALFF